jgi:tetratricopeptide (TPR) repeat protein
MTGTKPRLSMITLIAIALAMTSAFGEQQDERGLRVARINGGTALDGRGSLWAVVVGVSTYKNLRPEEQLRFAHRDAEDFASFLRSPNGGGFPSSNVKLLLNQQASLAAIRTALGTWLPRSAQADDVVYIFFAGHGVVEGDRDGYLLAYDSDPQNLYATALSVAELDTIIRERVHARNIVLIADACHAGRLGWQSRGAPERAMINSYLDEVGKSGSGLLRILASRADQRSFEDEKWGGGHGAFTYFLLQGLRGKADKDKDHFVRAAELLDYLAEVVPAETQALQQPRAAGAIDPRLPLAVVDTVPATTGPTRAGDKTTGPAPESLQLEVRGAPGTEVYVDKVFRGRIRPEGVLVIDKLSKGQHEFSVEGQGMNPVTQSVSLAAPRSILELKPASSSGSLPGNSTLVGQIRQSLERGLVLGQGGAWNLYLQLLERSPNDPQRSSIEVDLSNALEEIGQEAISNYVNSSASGLAPDIFHRASVAFTSLRRLNPSSSQFESKRLFCEGRALIVEGRNREAVPLLEQAVALDPKAAYSYNALGVAYENTDRAEQASDCFKKAADLAPNWSLPRMHIGIQYFNRGKLDKAEDNFKQAAQIDARDGFARLMLARTYRLRSHYDDAEREISDLLRMAPKYATAYAELGMLYEATGRFDKAADAYSTYLRLAPDSKDSPAIRRREEEARKMAQGKGPSLRKKP